MGGSLWPDDASVQVVWVNNFLHPVDQIQLARGQGSPALDGEPI